MPRIFCIVILVVTAAAAQSASQGAVAKPATSKKSIRNVVAPSDPVITLDGVCAKTAQSKQALHGVSCKTQISRKDFEMFVRALSATRGEVDPGSYRAAADAYSKLVIGSELGENAGVERDPRFAQVLQEYRLAGLGDVYRVHKLKQILNIPAEDIEAYYQKNVASYEEVALDRFVLPKNNPKNLSDVDFRSQARKLADELRARAVKGEDIYKLEKEGLEKLALNEEPATVPVGVRRGQLEEKVEKEIFALGPDGVTPVLDTPGLWQFYKRTSRRTLPLDLVGSEIRAKLVHDKVDSIEKSLHDETHVDYNEAYFGPDPAARKGETQPGKAPENAKPEGEAVSAGAVPPEAAVLTIHGLCGKKEAPQASCTQVVSRQQFETLLKIRRLTTPSVVQPPLRILAQEQVDRLIYANAAENAGVEKDPRLADAMTVARRRALSDMYRLKVDEQAHHVSAAELEAYYKQNLPGFERISLLHISIPRSKPGFAKDPLFDAKAEKLAAQLRRRAVKGEDINKLQKQAYETLGLQNPPAALMSPVRRGTLDLHTEQEVFALKPGGVTTVQSFPPAYVIYKLVSRRTIPLEEAKAEISAALYQKKIEKFNKAHGAIRAELNEKYFAGLLHGEGSGLKDAVAAK